MKKYGLLLVALLVLSAALAACSTKSEDSAKDYMEAVLKGDVEEAQKYACESYAEQTAIWAEMMVLEDVGLAVKNIELNYDLGKGNNQEEILVTGSFEIVELSIDGDEVADSAKEYELASSLRDKHDLDGDGDDDERINTRIVLTMQEDGDDWCVEGLEGGYLDPEFADDDADEDVDEGEHEGDDVDDAADADDDDDDADDEEDAEGADE
ncbi:MAG: hypothetical protein K8S97_08560 [Anaerolineae bacterium]|nr:hypothetical protein [Anaerolineae bacterium]